MDQLEKLHQNIAHCQRCHLCQTRVKAVLDHLPAKPVRLMLLGEAPGGHEATVSGEPFSGQAGEILQAFLDKIALSREALYVTNLVKCRPTQTSKRPRYGKYANRKPKKDEIAICAPYVVKEIELIRPSLLVSLGKTPTEWIFQKSVVMARVHGNLYYKETWDVFVYVMYHPASLLYNRSLQEAYEKDMAQLKVLLQKEGISRYENFCHI